MTPYESLVAEWKDCQLCSLCSGRQRVVFARGQIPADVLFVGEAPGESEDCIGAPFIGPAGKLLNSIIQKAFPPDRCCCGTPLDGSHDHNSCGPPIPAPSFAFFNLVGCFPKEAKENGDHQPPVEAIKACMPRLSEFIRICRPKMVVCVGSLADSKAPEAVRGCIIYAGGKVEDHPTIRHWTSIIHPAAILRAPQAQQSMMLKKAVVTLAAAVENL